MKMFLVQGNIITDDIGYYVNGLARDSMAEILRKMEKNDIFLEGSWLSKFNVFKSNPCILGFLVEQACLSSIQRNGLILDKKYKPSKTIYFSKDGPVIDFDKGCTL